MSQETRHKLTGGCLTRRPEKWSLRSHPSIVELLCLFFCCTVYCIMVHNYRNFDCSLCINSTNTVNADDWSSLGRSRVEHTHTSTVTSVMLRTMPVNNTFCFCESHIYDETILCRIRRLKFVEYWWSGKSNNFIVARPGFDFSSSRSFPAWYWAFNGWCGEQAGNFTCCLGQLRQH